MVGRADVPAEHLDPTDRRDRPEVTREVLVAEHHLLDREPEPEGHDREVDPPGAEGGDGEHRADEDGEDHAREERELGRPVLLSDQSRRDERAEPADRVLRE